MRSLRSGDEADAAIRQRQHLRRSAQVLDPLVRHGVGNLIGTRIDTDDTAEMIRQLARQLSVSASDIDRSPAVGSTLRKTSRQRGWILWPEVRVGLPSLIEPVLRSHRIPCRARAPHRCSAQRRSRCGSQIPRRAMPASRESELPRRDHYTVSALATNLELSCDTGLLGTAVETAKARFSACNLPPSSQRSAMEHSFRTLMNF